MRKEKNYRSDAWYWRCIDAFLFGLLVSALVAACVILALYLYYDGKG